MRLNKSFEILKYIEILNIFLGQVSDENMITQTTLDKINKIKEQVLFEMFYGLFFAIL